MNFIAIDFETATPQKHSICQVGLVRRGYLAKIFSSSQLNSIKQVFKSLNRHTTYSDINHSH
jgi:hypothetical protein